MFKGWPFNRPSGGLAPTGAVGPRPDEVAAVLAPETVEASDGRYDLTVSPEGYRIYDRGEVICTFHGPQFALACKVLRLLREDAAKGCA